MWHYPVWHYLVRLWMAVIARHRALLQHTPACVQGLCRTKELVASRRALVALKVCRGVWG